MKALNWIFVRLVNGSAVLIIYWLANLAIVALFLPADYWPTACFDAVMSVLNLWSFYLQQSRSISTDE
jgi:hypothetical protein